MQVEDVLFIVVADGVGQFARSHEAADLAATLIPTLLEDNISPNDAILQLNHQLEEISNDSGGPLATTVTVCALTPLEDAGLQGEVWWVGNSPAYVLAEGNWVLASADAYHAGDAQYQSSESFVDTATKALPLSVVTVKTARFDVPAGGSVFVMSDGVDDPLSASDQVRATLATWWETPSDIFSFASEVEFSRKGYVDDRTVVGVWVGGRSASTSDFSTESK